MPQIPRHRRLIQLDLLRPRPERPQWATLPAEVKQKVFPLLVRLLKEEHVVRPMSPVLKETSND